jgi:hypothetical protein
VYPIGKANQAKPETNFITPAEKKALRSAANYFYGIMGPVDLEFTFKEGKLYAFQVRPYLSASSGNPIKMAPSVEALPVLSQTPLVKGVTRPEGFTGRIVVFTGNSSSDNLEQMQRYEASMGENPKPYIGVFADAGTVALSYEGNLCRMFVDPTLESTNAHNVQMLHDKIAKGDGSEGILYANGNAVEKLGEFYKFEPQGNFYVSDGEVTYFSNGVKGSFRGEGRSAIAASEQIDLAKVCETGTPVEAAEIKKPVSPAKQAVPAASGPVRLAIVEDNRDAADSLKQLISLLPATQDKFEVDVYYDINSAVAGFAQRPPAIVWSDYGLPGKEDAYWADLAQRKQAGSVQVIINSGYRGEGMPGALKRIMAQLSLGDQDIFPKPMDNFGELEKTLLRLH